MATVDSKNAPEPKKPKLLQAVEMILAEPEAIKQESQALMDKIRRAHPKKSLKEVRKIASNKVISNYSYYSAFVGGTTALSGIIPGLGTAVALTGGSASDLVASMKFQIEMTMAIASIYDHDILLEDQKRTCYIVAGIGMISDATKTHGTAITSKAFINLVQEHLKGDLLIVIKELFKKIGITFTRKGLEKLIPFGVGVVIGFSVNKGTTWYIGNKVRDFYSVDAEQADSEDGSSRSVMT